MKAYQNSRMCFFFYNYAKTQKKVRNCDRTNNFYKFRKQQKTDRGPPSYKFEAEGTFGNLPCRYGA